MNFCNPDEVRAFNVDQEVGRFSRKFNEATLVETEWSNVAALDFDNIPACFTEITRKVDVFIADFYKNNDVPSDRIYSAIGKTTDAHDSTVFNGEYAFYYDSTGSFVCDIRNYSHYAVYRLQRRDNERDMSGHYIDTTTWSRYRRMEFFDLTITENVFAFTLLSKRTLEIKRPSIIRTRGVLCSSALNDVNKFVSCLVANVKGEGDMGRVRMYSKIRNLQGKYEASNKQHTGLGVFVSEEQTAALENFYKHCTHYKNRVLLVADVNELFTSQALACIIEEFSKGLVVNVSVDPYDNSPEAVTLPLLAVQPPDQVEQI